MHECFSYIGLLQDDNIYNYNLSCSSTIGKERYTASINVNWLDPARVVWKVVNTIQRIAWFGFVNIYQLDSDISGG